MFGLLEKAFYGIIPDKLYQSRAGADATSLANGRQR
jgi:hypothetical protein